MSAPVKCKHGIFLVLCAECLCDKVKGLEAVVERLECAEERYIDILVRVQEFPTRIRKMWSAHQVIEWITDVVNAPPIQESSDG